MRALCSVIPGAKIRFKQAYHLNLVWVSNFNTCSQHSQILSLVAYLCAIRACPPLLRSYTSLLVLAFAKLHLSKRGGLKKNAQDAYPSLFGIYQKMEEKNPGVSPGTLTYRFYRLIDYFPAFARRSSYLALALFISAATLLASAWRPWESICWYRL